MLNFMFTLLIPHPNTAPPAAAYKSPKAVGVWESWGWKGGLRGGGRGSKLRFWLNNNNQKNTSLLLVS